MQVFNTDRNQSGPTPEALPPHPDATSEAGLSTMPILYKVLIANSLVVLSGAVAGTYMTARFIQEDVVPTREWMVLLFAVVGVVLSLAVNYWVLKVAFEPLDSLERVATAVMNGDYSARTEPWRFGDPQLLRFSDTFNQTLDALEDDRRQIQQLASQVVQAQEDERQRISRELHDDTAQVLFAQLLRVTALKTSSSEEVRDIGESLEEMTVEAIEGVRRMALELRPPALDDLGVREALGELAQRFEDQTGVSSSYHMEGDRSRLQSDIELMIYRIAQEALTNIAKHAEASRAEVDLTRTDHEVILTVIDDGVGLNASGQRDTRTGIGLGIFGMAERAQLVGGTFSIEERQPRGTRVVARLPLVAQPVHVTPENVMQHRRNRDERRYSGIGSNPGAPG